ncbi:putative serine incorporator/TMS membrane protein [Rosa chinensis]|uniref:Putative serine incorporator/TMS membrane protein n=1 Tax=Rosa chinensis TaxID=74649 RepID=A0A2P6RJK4_ROSCH|nr:probable serine incorporator isoform X2 [Rosa chinensis]PRQ46612.1 putative serine incorporator/TMS membrane protein [Rosa chinensis]
MESPAPTGNNERSNTFKVDTWFSQFRNGSNPWMARYVYGLMFLLANLLAWAVRDYGKSFLMEMKRLERCGGQNECLAAEGVLRVSLGCFLFYFSMFLSTAGASKLNESRDTWQSGWWSAKIVLWIVFIIIPFLLPSAIIKIYGVVAHFGAGVFLLIQLISIISFIRWVNDCCQYSKSERCQIHSMLIATTAYVVSLVGIIMMYIWYSPDPSCFINIFFITWTLVLLQLMTSVSLHPKVNAGILTPGLMGLYIVFICWFAIRSEPVAGNPCNRKAEASQHRDWLSIISFVIGVLAIVIATFSTGIDSKCFQFKKDETESEDDVPYGYGFFHFVFATGAMYFAMLLISWNTTNHTMEKWTIDVGWTSTWVRIVNEWIAVCVYLWMLVGPIIWKSRQTAQSVV